MPSAESSIRPRTRSVTVSFGDSATGTHSVNGSKKKTAEVLRALGFRATKRWNHGTAELGVVAWKQRWQKLGSERAFTSYRKRYDVPVPLLNAAKVAKAEEVWLSESHSDCDTLMTAGVIATTNWQGAHNWTDEDAAQLRGKSVVIVRHRDLAGQEFVRDVIASLPGEQVRVVEPYVGNDARDHLEAGHTIKQFRKVNV